MSEDRAPLGLLIAALGAAVLAVSVFAPWYGVSVTPSGAAAAQQQLAAVARQYGNTNLQRESATMGTQFHALVGRQLATVSAHQSLKHVSLILLMLAGIALLASLLRLANMRGLLYASGSQIALLGGLAGLISLFRMLWPPGASVGFVTLSPLWGIWLALVSAAAVLAGGLMAGSDRSLRRSDSRVGPGPPTLMAPPTVRAMSQGALSRPANRRR
jgi:hypothetical protein